jgi:6-phosphofructokinase
LLEEQAMKIGMLTGGGDCPGLNAVIRAVVRKGSFHYEDQFVGFVEGWRGVLEGKTMELDLESVGGILPRGGTILRTSRTNPAKREGGLQRCAENLKKHGCDALIAIGGDDTLSVAKKLFDNGVNVVGVPKTIDNDLAGTDFTFGFDTAVNVATEAIDRVHTTAEAHNRVIVVEVMGRDAGWIAIYSGIAGGADVILIPEVPFDIDQVAELIRQRHARGRYFSIVVAAEGARFAGGGETDGSGEQRDEFGHLRMGGIGLTVANESWRRATDWALSTWCTEANLDIWRRCGETRLFPFRWQKPSLPIARWTRKFLMLLRAFLTGSTIRPRIHAQRIDNQGLSNL